VPVTVAWAVAPMRNRLLTVCDGANAETVTLLLVWEAGVVAMGKVNAVPQGLLAQEIATELTR